MIIGYASGAFDMFHIGHLNLLRRASLMCDYLLVGVVLDETYAEVRGKPPMVPFDERLAIVRSIKFVDAAVGDPYHNKLKTWHMYRFDVLIKGDDWKESPKAESMMGALQERGIPVAFVPYTQHTSSSRLRQRIADLEERYR